MGNPKKLNLSYEQLCTIAKDINRNREDNKTRTKEDRIDTDTFLRKKFNIARKDFSYSIKNTGIEYNPRTFMYEFQCCKSNPKALPSINYNEVSTIVELIPKEAKNKNCKSNTSVMYSKLEEALPVLLEMVEWYKSQSKVLDKNKNIEPDVSRKELSGDIKNHSIKCYENIYQEFLKLCGQYPAFKNQDLISLALLDFINKHRK